MESSGYRLGCQLIAYQYDGTTPNWSYSGDGRFVKGLHNRRVDGKNENLPEGCRNEYPYLSLSGWQVKLIILIVILVSLFSYHKVLVNKVVTEAVTEIQLNGKRKL